ncbi:outer membrane beta-barrel protein [Marinoscillum furvescens]|uniref:Outer membrane protein with beta-barrel domain n=1 Tax=Marinoscillum furvescens DSM 4134 TaxID=1122208 RepID=A0A3D9KXF4_MARFU|nr:outer membrane beta-barrel protein [Marinoscillum furvescens]RED91589.1 outer membrane protein with beta-barrel domain [Marinoscillum furvescens DSM 4134]
MKRICGFFLLSILTFSVFAQDENKPKQPDLPGNLMIDFGFNRWSEEPDNLPLGFLGSNSVGIYYNRRLRFNDHISFHPGIGFTFEKYAFEDRYTWLRDDDGTVDFDSLSGVGFRKNKLVSNYLEIPIEFRIHPLGTVNGEGFFIGIGAVGGMRIGSHTKIKYDIGEDTVKEKLYDGFGLSDFRYGLQGRLGFRAIHVFYKYWLNDVFSTSPDANKSPQAWTVGINFSGF